MSITFALPSTSKTDAPAFAGRRRVLAGSARGRIVVAAILSGAAFPPAFGQTADAPPAGDAAVRRGAGSPAVVCDQAANLAEAQFGIPAGLLSAIGKVESSRWRPELRRSVTWPFAIDSSGYDIFPETAELAVSQVRSLQAEGIQSIDVGCFQINLFYHPDAFASLEDGFDPVLNAAYAARFLVSLRERTGSWTGAVAAYHSFDPSRGEPYRARVYAAWQGGAALGDDAAPLDQPDGKTFAQAGSFMTLSVMRNAVPGRLGSASIFAGVRVVVPSQFMPISRIPGILPDTAFPASTAAPARWASVTRVSYLSATTQIISPTQFAPVPFSSGPLPTQAAARAAASLPGRPRLPRVVSPSRTDLALPVQRS